MGGLPNELIPDPHIPKTVESQIGDRRLSTSCGVVTMVVVTLFIWAGRTADGKRFRSQTFTQNGKRQTLHVNEELIDTQEWAVECGQSPFLQFFLN